jgi:cyclophilin family peptidyl-prolyl cis-trans isomerase
MKSLRPLVLIAAAGFLAVQTIGLANAAEPVKVAEKAKVVTAKKVADTMVLERSMKKDPGPSNEYAVVKTNMGTIVLRFFPKQAPLAVSNFKGLAAKGFYKGVTFHRIIDGFMIQGGDPTGTGRGGESLWKGTFADEFSPELRFERAGILAMANRGPATNSSQFFITLAPTGHLNNKHTIFGEVVEGMDVINAMAKVAKDAQDKPLKPVTMDSITFETR